MLAFKKTIFPTSTGLDAFVHRDKNRCGKVAPLSILPTSNFGSQIELKLSTPPETSANLLVCFPAGHTPESC